MFPFTWEILKIAAGSKLSRAAGLAPILGWLLVKNNEFGKFLAELFDIQSLATPSPSLFLFYCGLFCFGFGVLFFSFFCPVEIKDYSSQEDYRSKRLPTLTRNDQEVVNLGRMVSKKDNLSGDFLSHDQFVRDNKSDLLDLLAENYQSKNLRSKYIRVLISILISLGAIMTFIPSIQTFIEILFSQLFK